jgi:hypothetical protein
MNVAFGIVFIEYGPTYGVLLRVQFPVIVGSPVSPVVGSVLEFPSPAFTLPPFLDECL